MTKRLKQDIDIYLNVIGKSGGGIKMEDLPLLVNIEYKNLIEKGKMRKYKYSKVAADIRKIEELIESGRIKEFKIYISQIKNKYGKPDNYKYITLTKAGWYKFQGESRPELQIGNKGTQNLIKFNALKHIVLKDKYNTHLAFKESILKDYKYIEQVYIKKKYGSHMKGRVEVDEFLKKDNFFIGDIKILGEEKIYNVKMLYIQPTFGRKNFCESIDKVLGIFEREQSLEKINKHYKIEIEIDIITNSPILVVDMFNFFNKYKREYAYYSMYSQKSINNENIGNSKDGSKLGHYKSAKIIKYFNFYTVNNDYTLSSY